MAIAVRDDPVTSPARTIIVPAVAPVPTWFSPNTLRWPMAEPDDVLDYALDVSGPLLDSGGDSIASASVSVAPSGIGELSVQSIDVEDPIITAWLSGGVAGRHYTVRIEATTDGGRTFEWLIGLRIDPELATYPMPRLDSPHFGDAVTWPIGSRTAVYNVSKYNDGSTYQ